MPAGRYDITIEQGATFQLSVAVEEPEGTPKSLVGWSIASKVRLKPSDSTALLTFDVIPLDLAQGRFQLYAAASSTAALTASDPPQRKIGFWDVEITSGSTVLRLLKGSAIIDPEITR